MSTTEDKLPKQVENAKKSLEQKIADLMEAQRKEIAALLTNSESCLDEKTAKEETRNSVLAVELLVAERDELKKKLDEKEAASKIDTIYELWITLPARKIEEAYVVRFLSEKAAHQYAQKVEAADKLLRGPDDVPVTKMVEKKHPVAN